MRSAQPSPIPIQAPLMQPRGAPVSIPMYHLGGGVYSTKDVRQ